MRFFWFLTVLLAGACADLAPRAPSAAVEFELAGRIAARFRDDSFSGNLAWRHARDSDEILLTSLLGAGVARIVREGDAVVISTAEPREYRAHSAEALTEEVLGFPLPLDGLADWVQGRPSPALESRGWKIEYLEYDAERRPTRMRLTYPGLELRLAISQWK